MGVFGSNLRCVLLGVSELLWCYGGVYLAARHGERILTCHGGALETPADFEALLAREPRLHGYVGGSSAERFPIEQSVPEATRGFKAVRLPAS